MPDEGSKLRASDAQLVRDMRALVERMNSIADDQLIRRQIRDVSVPFLASMVYKIKARSLRIDSIVMDLDNNTLRGLIKAFERIVGNMEHVASLTDGEFIGSRDTFLDALSEGSERIDSYWPAVVAAAVEARGILDEDFALKYENAMRDANEEIERGLRQARDEIGKSVDKARKTANDIQQELRQTAEDISVTDAQIQFAEAQTNLDKQALLWGCFSLFGFVFFVAAALIFLNREVPNELRWGVIYYSSIRLSILTAFATITAFCLRTFRAHLHMSEKNRHRQHVAKSLQAFVQAASTPEQRDMILGQLVESIVQFGNSGLVQREDGQMYRPRLTIDQIIRALSPNAPRDSG